MDRKHTYHPHSTKAIDTNSLFDKRHLLFQLSLLVFQRFNLLKNHRELHVSYNPSSQRSGSYTGSLGNLDKKEFLAITINNGGAVIAWVDCKQSLFLKVSWEASQRENNFFFLFCIKINKKLGYELTLGSNELAFFSRSSSTLALISGVIFRASKEQISSFTPRFARKLKR